MIGIDAVITVFTVAVLVAGATLGYAIGIQVERRRGRKKA